MNKNILIVGIIFAISSFGAVQDLKAWYGILVQGQHLGWFEESVSYSGNDVVYKSEIHRKEGGNIVDEIYQIKSSKGTFEPQNYSYILNTVGKSLDYSGKSLNKKFNIKAKANKDAPSNFTIDTNFIFSSLVPYKLVEDAKKNPKQSDFEYKAFIEDSLDEKFQPVKIQIKKMGTSQESLPMQDGSQKSVTCDKFQYKQFNTKNEVQLESELCLNVYGQLVSLKNAASGLVILAIPQTLAKVFLSK